MKQKFFTPCLLWGLTFISTLLLTFTCNTHIVKSANHTTILHTGKANTETLSTTGSWIQQSKLTASDGVAFDKLGYSVALSDDGNTAIASAIYATVNGVSQQGAVYVYTRVTGAWTQQAKLIANESTAGRFGESVALSSDGNTALVGAYGTTVNGHAYQGAVYVYTRTGTIWTQQTKLTADDGAEDDQFGISVALSSNGNKALLGAWGANVNGHDGQGAAYLFTRTGTIWTQQTKLTASDGAAYDSFGTSVALNSDGNTALVGAWEATVNSHSSQGAAYVFTQTGLSWSQQTKLTASDGAANDSFGTSVTLNNDGNTALVGTYNGNTSGYNVPGKAYVFTRSSTIWSQQTKLTASDGAANDYFGYSVALNSDGNQALLGAWGANLNGWTQHGAAYVYTRSGITWGHEAKLAGAAGGALGYSVSISGEGNLALAGADSATVNGHPLQGAVYGFVPYPLYLPCVVR